MTPASERHTLHRGPRYTLVALPGRAAQSAFHGQRKDREKQKLFSSRERAQGDPGQGSQRGGLGGGGRLPAERLVKDTVGGVAAGGGAQGWARGAGRVPLGACEDGLSYAGSLVMFKRHVRKVPAPVQEEGEEERLDAEG